MIFSCILIDSISSATPDKNETVTEKELVEKWVLYFHYINLFYIFAYNARYAWLLYFFFEK